MYIGILSSIYYYYNNMHVKYSLEIVTFFCEIHGKVLPQPRLFIGSYFQTIYRKCRELYTHIYESALLNILNIFCVVLIYILQKQIHALVCMDKAMQNKTLR